MTLILGINLSDRLYLAGDSRLTYHDGNYTDNIIKVSSIGDIGDIPVIAVAGNIKFAKYMYDKILKGLVEKSISSNIRILYNQIEEFCQLQIEKWVEDNNFNTPPDICIMFGGINKNNLKEINLDRINILKQIHKKNIPSQSEIDNLEQQLESDPIFKTLQHKFPFVKTQIKDLSNPNALQYDHKYSDGLENKKHMDSFIFSVSISQQGIKVDTAEWGEMLAYGTHGITKENISDSLLADLEVGYTSSVAMEHFHETGQIRDEISKIAKEKNIAEIGGPVNTIVINEEGSKELFIYTKKCLNTNRSSFICKMEDEYHYMPMDKDVSTKLIYFHEWSGIDSEAKL